MITMPQLEFIDLLKEIEPKKVSVPEQMELGITEEATFGLLTSGTSQLLNLAPCTSITFSDGTSQCGSFTWKDGIFKFEGNVETSARLFANYVAQYCGLKVQS